MRHDYSVILYSQKRTRLDSSPIYEYFTVIEPSVWFWAISSRSSKSLALRWQYQRLRLTYLLQLETPLNQGRPPLAPPYPLSLPFQPLGPLWIAAIRRRRVLMLNSRRSPGILPSTQKDGQRTLTAPPGCEPSGTSRGHQLSRCWLAAALPSYPRPSDGDGRGKSIERSLPLIAC
jgi:hypothetical protein